MNTNDSSLGSASTGFALAAAATVLVSTALAIGKDLSPALTSTMAHMSGHHWSTQAIVDVTLFTVLGFLFTNLNFATKISPCKVMATLTVSVIIAGGGLSLWYLLF